jgi:hypothetical protein
MNSLSCAEVVEQLELYALHEGAAATSEAVAQHLARCLSCARAYQRARHMLVLLDLTERQPAALARLRVRIAGEARRAEPPKLLRPGPRRGLALAALLLITLGLGWMLGLPMKRDAEPPQGPVVALLLPDARKAKALPFGPEAVPGVRAEQEIASQKEDIIRLSLAGLRRELDAGRTPAPPPIDLALRLHNRGSSEIVLALAEGRYEFRIDLTGPETQRRLPSGPGEKPLSAPGIIKLPPGGTYTVPVRWLSEVVAGRVQYVYWTKPGRYTLAVRLRVRALSPAGEWTIVTPPRTIEVQDVSPPRPR